MFIRNNSKITIFAYRNTPNFFLIIIELMKFLTHFLGHNSIPCIPLINNAVIT